MKKLLLLIAIIIIAAQTNAQQKQSAQSIIDAACKEAAQQNKNAFIIFHASWCGWCHKLDSNINSASLKPFFSSNYVVAHVTVFENDSTRDDAGARIFLANEKADKQGIPVWFIFNGKGKLLASSFIRKQNEEGVNVGCPAEPQEVDYFLQVLAKTSSVTDEQKAMVKKTFAKAQP